jgi:hypothetical protein
LCLSARNRRKAIGKELAVYSQLLLGLGAPDSVRCARPVSGEQAALGTRRRRTAIIHRMVRWCTGPSGESSAAKSSLSGKVQRRTAKIHRTVRWCTGLSGEPTVDCATVGRAIRGRRVARANSRQGHQTVRCANCYESTTVGCDRKGRRSPRTGQL